MKILIVDDEAPARRRLRSQLRQLGHDTIVGEAKDGRLAQAAIEELRPDVVFLDIQLPHLDGLEVAASSGTVPAVVFVTAYDEFALRAFEIGAVDYLLKPVSLDRLARTLTRLQTALDVPNPAVADVVGTLSSRDAIPPAARIVCPGQDRLRIFDARTIGRFWASDKYTMFRADGVEQMTDDSLVALEGRLEPFGFVRVHRAELVNLALARGLRRGRDGTVVELADGQVAPVSRRRVAAVRAQLAARRGD